MVHSVPSSELGRGGRRGEGEEGEGKRGGDQGEGGGCFLDECADDDVSK